MKWLRRFFNWLKRIFRMEPPFKIVKPQMDVNEDGTEIPILLKFCVFDTKENRIIECFQNIDEARYARDKAITAAQEKTKDKATEQIKSIRDKFNNTESNTPKPGDS